MRQAALAVRSSRLAEELQESRERLVLAREEERRRIRRDLHDGLGPALSGVVFRIESARLLVPDDPSAATRGLEVAAAQVQDVVADVRSLVHDLRPPALDDLGLVGALRQQATALTGPGFGVHVEADERVATLPAAVEVAAYRVVGEAVTNAARHAQADHVHRDHDEPDHPFEGGAWTGAGVLDADRLIAALRGLPKTVIRAKGWVVTDRHGPALVHLAGGRVRITRAPHRPGAVANEVVYIGIRGAGVGGIISEALTPLLESGA